MKQRAILAVMAIGVASGSVLAQGVPVIDLTSITKQIEQLTEARNQLAQLQQTYQSFNHVTNMGDIASLLNNPAIRQALPKDFGTAEAALMGQGATGRQQADQVYTPGGNAFYASEVARIQGANAGQKSVAQSMYDAAGKRLDGIEQLRLQIGQSSDPKTTMDLQARLGVEMAAAQQDTLKMQALAMLQQAEAQVEAQRQREDYEREIQAGIQRLGGQGNGASGAATN